MSGTAIQPVLRMRNVSRTFGAKVVHKNISFDLYHGEILALMGSSGSGKSLILKTLVGLTAPDSGQIMFDGKNLCALNESTFRKVRKKIGYVFQSGALFNSLTVEENLAYPLKLHTDLSPDEIHKKIDERLERLDLKGTNDLYPDEISGGMQRRVGLLRATMLDPTILLFDEPTAGLDPEHVAFFSRALQRLKREREYSGILVTHDVQSAFAVSDRIALMKDGSIYAIGTVEEMKQTQDKWVHSFLFPDFGELAA
jgi:phospholipid/cholesterol/gamma-HCH transport system ATP-binding protein